MLESRLDRTPSLTPMAISNHNTIKLLLIIINHCEPLYITLEISMDQFYFIFATNLEANFKNAFMSYLSKNL